MKNKRGKLFVLMFLSVFLVSLVSAEVITSDLNKIISEKTNEEIQIIISFKERPIPSQVQELVAEQARIRHEYTIIDAIAVKVPANAIEKISRKHFVESVEPDYEVKLVLDKSIYEIEVEKVWENEITGSGINVAVIDTGIFNHEVLTIIKEVDFTGEGTEDLHGHGTHVAGIIASQDLKYMGVAYNSNLFNIKVLNKQGSGYGSDVIKGIEWAVDNGADIISLSLGARVSSCDGKDAISRAVDNAVRDGSIAVVAAGNAGPDSETITSPGCAKEAITIGATDGNNVPSFSSRGPTADGRIKPDLVAPGVRITSTWLNNEFRSLSGTSMATPHVSGVIALLLEVDSSLNTNELKNILAAGAIDLGLDENTQGAGKVNAYKSYLFLTNKTEEPVEDEPVDDEPEEDEDKEKEKKSPPGLDRKIERGRRPQGIGYGLTRAWERVQLAFTFKENNKAELHLRFAERRLSEAIEIIEEDEERAKELLEEYERNLERGNEISGLAQQIGKNVSRVMELIATATIIHEEVLRDVLERVPEEAKPAIERAINNSRTGNENALRAMQEISPEKAADMHLRIAERKIEQIRERNETENESSIREIEERIKKAEEMNGNIDTERKREILGKVSESTSKHKEVLEETLERVPEEAKPAIEKAIERANQGQERATKAIENIPEQKSSEQTSSTPSQDSPSSESSPSQSPSTPEQASGRGITGRVIDWVSGK
jgi:hypothetical protein